MSVFANGYFKTAFLIDQVFKMTGKKVGFYNVYLIMN